MRSRPLVFLLLLAAALPARAQSTEPTPHPVAEPDDTLTDDQAEEGRPGMQYGFASGALGYKTGLSEQTFGVIARWVPVRWLSLSATPTMARVSAPATSTTGAYSQSGFEDLPLEAAVSHGFGGSYEPTLSGSLGMSLPLGDSASGFGSGSLSSSVNVGLGLVPVHGVWMHLGAGRTLGTLSAFSTSSSWGDMSAGTDVNDRVGVSGGFSTDLGSVDPAIGRSTSLESGLSFHVADRSTLNVAASKGLSGAAPNWSLAIGFGTAFPYLNHLGSSGSSMRTLNSAVGGGSYGSTVAANAHSGRGRP